MNSTTKSVIIDNFLSEITGKNRFSVIKNGNCVGCDETGITENSFVDKLSIKEYQISGLCQKCQDKVWR